MAILHGFSSAHNIGADRNAAKQDKKSFLLVFRWASKGNDLSQESGRFTRAVKDPHDIIAIESDMRERTVYDGVRLDSVEDLREGSNEPLPSYFVHPLKSAGVIISPDIA